MLVIPNLLSAFFLIFAVYFARQRRIRAHKIMVSLTMLTSFVLVYLFLEIRLRGGGFVPDGTFVSLSMGSKSLLLSHILAACLTFVLSLVVWVLGLTENRKKWHKKLAYVLLPIWAYSSISGIGVFFTFGDPSRF